MYYLEKILQELHVHHIGNTGNMSPKIPAKAKGINNFIEVDNLILLYNF